MSAQAGWPVEQIDVPFLASLWLYRGRTPGSGMLQDGTTQDAFTAFVAKVEQRLRHALIPLAGLEAAQEATADALAYAWEHWEHIEPMNNPAG